MPISLIDVVKYYSGTSHQAKAVQRLQQQIQTANPALLADTSDFAKLWRNQVSVRPEFLITSSSIGSAVIGQTYGQIKKALGDQYTFSDEPRFMVDLAAVAVIRDGISGFFSGSGIAFYLVYPFSETLKDNTPINLIVTANPTYKTAQGTGPGTLISEAVRDYGNALLSFNTEAESREFVAFSHGPSGLSFRAEALSHSLAGDYAVPSAVNNGSFHQTSAFFENASVSQVWLQSSRP